MRCNKASALCGVGGRGEGRFVRKCFLSWPLDRCTRYWWSGPTTQRRLCTGGTAPSLILTWVSIPPLPSPPPPPPHPSPTPYNLTPLRSFAATWAWGFVHNCSCVYFATWHNGVAKEAETLTYVWKSGMSIANTDVTTVNVVGVCAHSSVFVKGELPSVGP